MYGQQEAETVGLGEEPGKLERCFGLVQEISLGAASAAAGGNHPVGDADQRAADGHVHAAHAVHAHTPRGAQGRALAWRHLSAGRSVVCWVGPLCGWLL